MKIGPANKVVGEICLPGDKSISHRAIMIGAIATGETRIRNFATSIDCSASLECFRGLGVTIDQEGTDVIVHGVDKCGLMASESALDCGNSGTTMRLISGILAGQSFETELTGDESLQSRPMARIIDPLTQMGATIESRDGKAPLKIIGRGLTSIRYSLPVASAQIKSCVLFAGLYADGTTTVIESTPTRDHTERMLRGFGVNVSVLGKDGHAEISVSGRSELSGAEIFVPGDISSAAFFLVAAACLPGSELRLPSVGLNPTRSAVVDVLRGFGARVYVGGDLTTSREPVGDIVVHGGLKTLPDRLKFLRGPIVTNLIDELPILAVLGTRLKDGLEVRNASELRIKETDRIKAIVENLKRMNADVEEFDDGFRVGRSNLEGAALDSYGDHRIAMAFAVAGLLADGETEIVGAECADVSFPGFFDVLSQVTE